MLPPWTPNLTQREVGRPKVSICDSALALQLARQSESHFHNILTPDVGRFFEGFIVGEILKQQTWSEQDYRVFHYRRRNTEVDVIIELFDARIIAIEIKASATFKADFFKNLRLLKDNLGDRMLAGIVFGLAEQAYQYGSNLWGLPADALWDWQ